MSTTPRLILVAIVATIMVTASAAPDSRRRRRAERSTPSIAAVAWSGASTASAVN